VKELWSCKQKKSRWERYVEEIGEVDEGEYFLDDGFCRLGSTFQAIERRYGVRARRDQGLRDVPAERVWHLRFASRASLGTAPPTNSRHVAATTRACISDFSLSRPHFCFIVKYLNSAIRSRLPSFIPLPIRFVRPIQKLIN
jgi:hypothetical protein